VIVNLGSSPANRQRLKELYLIFIMSRKRHTKKFEHFFVDVVLAIVLVPPTVKGMPQKVRAPPKECSISLIAPACLSVRPSYFLRCLILSQITSTLTTAPGIPTSSAARPNHASIRDSPTLLNAVAAITMSCRY
jgi:hypothetical protein